MQDRQLVPFSVSKLHFLYNIVLVQARTRLIFAVAGSRVASTQRLICTTSHHCRGSSTWAQCGRGSTWVVLFLWTPSPFLYPLPLVLLLLLFPANTYLNLCSLFPVPPSSLLQPPAGGGSSEWHMDSAGALN